MTMMAVEVGIGIFIAYYLDIHSQEKTSDSLRDLTKLKDITKNKKILFSISLDIFLPVIEVSSLHFEDLVFGLLSQASLHVYRFLFLIEVKLQPKEMLTHLLAKQVAKTQIASFP